MRRLLVPVVVLVAVSSASLAAAVPAASVRDVQQLSAASPFPACPPSDQSYRDLATEPTLAVVPGHPQVRIAAWIQDNANGIVTAHSTDGGRTWERVVAPGLAACSGSAYGYRAAYDPWLSIGPDGVAYLVAGANSPPTGLPDPASTSPFDGSVQLVTSRDGGASWQRPVVVARDENTSFILDKPTVTADPARPGVVYATWTRIAALGGSASIELARSTDHGATWATQEVAVPPPGSLYTGSQVLVLPDGALVLSLVEASAQPLAATGTFLGDTTVLALRSADEGRTWLGPVVIGTADGAPSLYSSATDEQGRLAVAWVHLGAIDVARSTDRGATWRTRTAVPATYQPFLPTLAAGDDGRLHLLYDDHRSHAADGRPLTDVWLAESGPGASPWREAHLGGPFDMATAPAANGAGGRPLGDYQGIALVGREVAVAFGQDRPASSVGATGVFYAAVR